MGLITRIADKAGALGSVVSAMGCAACFPAIASLGAAIGLGFTGEEARKLVVELVPDQGRIELILSLIERILTGQR